MARTKKGGAEPPETEAEDTRQAKPSETTLLIGEKNLRKLLRDDAGIKSQVDELVGTLREKIGHAVDKQHLNKKVYALLKPWYRMSEDQLADYWPVFLFYMEASGLMAKIDEATEGRLPLGDDAEDSNVTRLQPRGGGARPAGTTAAAAGPAKD